MRKHHPFPSQVAAHNKENKPSDALVVSTAVVVIRQLIQQGACKAESPTLGRRDVVRRLARLLLKPEGKGAAFSTEPRKDVGDAAAASTAAASAKPGDQGRGATARANVVWLLGEAPRGTHLFNGTSLSRSSNRFRR